MPPHSHIEQRPLLVEKLEDKRVGEGTAAQPAQGLLAIVIVRCACRASAIKGGGGIKDGVIECSAGFDAVQPDVDGIARIVKYPNDMIPSRRRNRRYAVYAGCGGSIIRDGEPGSIVRVFSDEIGTRSRRPIFAHRRF